MSRLAGATWYRNVGGRFHLMREDWIRSGKGVCGASIRNPAFTSTDTPLSACRHCLRHYTQHDCPNCDGEGGFSDGACCVCHGTGKVAS